MEQRHFYATTALQEKEVTKEEYVLEMDKITESSKSLRVGSIETKEQYENVACIVDSIIEIMARRDELILKERQLENDMVVVFKKALSTFQSIAKGEKGND
jgi:hypothetical protein